MTHFRPLFLLLLAMIVSFSGYTNANETLSIDGKDEALLVCERMSMPSYKRECITLVGKTQYFDTDALPLCESFSLGSRVMECMTAVANRRYSAQEVRTCSGETFDSDKIECLLRLGEEYTGPSLSLRRELERVVRQIDGADYAGARRNLIRVIQSLD